MNIFPRMMRVIYEQHENWCLQCLFTQNRFFSLTMNENFHADYRSLLCCLPKAPIKKENFLLYYGDRNKNQSLDMLFSKETWWYSSWPTGLKVSEYRKICWLFPENQYLMTKIIFHCHQDAPQTLLLQCVIEAF